MILNQLVYRYCNRNKFNFNINETYRYPRSWYDCMCVYIYIFMSWIILGGGLCNLNRVYYHNNLMKHLLLPLWVKKLRPRGSVPCLWSLKYKLQSQVPSPGFLARVAQCTLEQNADWSPDFLSQHLFFSETCCL